MTDRSALARLGRAALPIIALLLFAFGVAATSAAAGDTLGYDFRAYHQAVERLASGAPLYDMGFTAAGGFGLFFYPPIFAVLVLPFAWLEVGTAIAVWTALSVAGFLAGVAVLPVGRAVRWWLILLAGLSFPFVHAVKLGQVGPLLFLLFAIGWRWMDDPARLGLSGALGAAVKVQPGLILVWALLTRRVAAVMIGAAGLVALAVVATLVTGVQAWTDFLTLLGTVTDPITTPQNLTPGAVAHQLGASTGVAGVIQLVSSIAVVAAVLVAIRRCTDEASYLIVVIASQLISPILWDHYAMLLLLPVAYLLAAGRWWALVIPLVTAWPLIGLTPAVVYPVAFWVTLLATFLVGQGARRAEPVKAAGTVGAAGAPGAA